MRDAAIKVIRAVGVETGGSNIQFAVNPADGELVVIEMNPRLSRSSALASKATGFPIAKFAAKLAVGWALEEIPNDITKQTPACFEPTIDYCVVKIPRFAFEKFPGVDATLTTQMQSVGEVLALGRTFKEALQKGLRRAGDRCRGFFVAPCRQRGGGVGGRRAEAPQRRAAVLHAAGPGARHERGRGRRAHPHRPLVRGQHGADPGSGRRAQAGAGAVRGAGRERAAAGQARRLLRPAVGRAYRLRRAHAARPAGGAGGASHLQAGGHLRGGVRGLHPLLLLHLRDGGRGDGGAGAQGDDRRRRPQPHRPGHRVRLLLLPGLVRPARAGLPVDHGQLQSRDRVHRLRHLRPPLLRAAHGGGRGQHLRQGAAGGGDPAVRRPDPAQHGARAGGAGREGAGHPPPTPSTAPRTAAASASCCRASTCASRRAASPTAWRRCWRRRAASATRCCCAPPTCSAGAPWRSSTTRRWCATTWRCTRARWPATTRRATAPATPDPGGQVPGGGGRDRRGPDRRRRAVHRRRRDAAHRGGGGALGGQRLLPAAALAAGGGGGRDQAPERGPGPGAGGARA